MKHNRCFTTKAMASVFPLATSIRATVNRVYAVSAKGKGNKLATRRAKERENKNRDMNY